MLKFANFQVIEAKVARMGHGLVKDSHRHAFEYEPRPEFLYVRSRAISSRCNDNFDEFPAEEIAVAYRTFVGKPVFVNHHNANHRRARGVIVDAVLHEDTNPDGSPDTWVEVLMEVDAVRFPLLAERIVTCTCGHPHAAGSCDTCGCQQFDGQISRTSMGCDVAYSKCSYCGNKAVSPVEYCDHIRRHKGRRIRRRTASGDGMEDVLVREVCYGLRFFENSLLVEDPADPTAFFLGVESGDDLVASGRKTADRKTRTPEWDAEDEELHPRDQGGKFTDSGNSGPTRVPDGTQDTAPTQEKPAEAEPTTHGPTTEAPAAAPEAPTTKGDDPHVYEGEDGTWHPHPETKGIGTKEDPVVTPSIEDAAKALSLGLHVELHRAPEVSTLLDRLAQMIEEAKASGTKLQIDLCNVTVRGTNLFCTESKGIPRSLMPQLKSLPEGLDPNGRAMAEVKPNEDGEYDIQPQFLQHLKDLGYEAEEIDYPAAYLKATQNQLNAGKVAGITGAILNGVNVNKEPIFVSEDDYIVDGHHRWAASVSADWSDGDVGDITMPVWKIKGLDIITLLDLSNKFAAEWGFKQQGVEANNGSNVPGVKAASKGCSGCGPTLDEMNAHAQRKMAARQTPIKAMALEAAQALVKEALPPGLNDIGSQAVTWRPSKTARPGGYEALIWDLPELDGNSHTNLNLFVSPARDTEGEAAFEMGLWTHMAATTDWQLEAHLLQPNDGPAALYLRPGGPSSAYSATEVFTGSLAAAQDRCEVMGWDLVARHFRGRRMASIQACSRCVKAYYKGAGHGCSAGPSQCRCAALDHDEERVFARTASGAYGTLWQTSTGYVHRSRSCPHVRTDGSNAKPVSAESVLEDGVVKAKGVKACTTCFPSAPVRRRAPFPLSVHADLTVAWPVTDDPCRACAGSGEQGTGHECYLCDGTGMGAVERASRLRGLANDNPENGLVCGRDDAGGILPLVAAMETPCQTSGTQFSTHISGDEISAEVDLPFDLDLTEREAETLEANVHNALELVLAPHFRESSKDGRFDGVSLKQDDDGWYVTTHRARSKSYPTPEDIPQAKVDFIASTGSLRAVAYQYPDGRKLDAAELGRIAVEEGFLTPEQVGAIGASNKHAYTDLEKVLRSHLWSMWASGLIDIGPLHDYEGPDDTWAAAEERSKAPSMAYAASATPLVGWHETHASNRASILANGLQSGQLHGGENLVWVYTDRGLNGTKVMPGFDLWRVDLSGLDVWPGFEVSAEWLEDEPVAAIDGTVPPSHLTLEVDGAAKEASLPKLALGPLDTPITAYGINYDPTLASQPLVARAANWDGFSRLAVQEVPLADLWATERTVSSQSIDKVVSGREPFREGYASHVLYDHQGRALLIDGHHRAAMYAALGHTTMPAHVATLSHITGRDPLPPTTSSDPTHAPSTPRTPTQRRAKARARRAVTPSARLSSRDACPYAHQAKIDRATDLLDRLDELPPRKQEHMRSIWGGALINLRKEQEVCRWCQDEPVMVASLSDAIALRRMAVQDMPPIKGTIFDPEVIKSIPPEHQDAFRKLMEHEQRRMNQPAHDGRYFHASPADLGPGTILRPGGGPVTDPGFYDSQRALDRAMGDPARESLVWISPDEDDVRFWAATIGATHVYEVEPKNPRPWRSGIDGWVCDSARIIRKVDHLASKGGSAAEHPFVVAVSDDWGKCPECIADDHAHCSLPGCMCVDPIHSRGPAWNCPRCKHPLSAGSLGEGGCEECGLSLFPGFPSEEFVRSLYADGTLPRTSALDTEGMEALMAAVETNTPVTVQYQHKGGVYTASGFPVGGGKGSLRLSDWPEREIAWSDIWSVKPAPTSKAAMADRSGVPEVDRLIEDFLGEVLDERNWGEGAGTIRDLMDGTMSHGMCQVVSEQFTDYAKARGFKAYSTDTDRREMGYRVQRGAPKGEIGWKGDEVQMGHYFEHTVVTLTPPGSWPNQKWSNGDSGDIIVDFTASQYGYKDHPKVTHASKQAGVLEWTGDPSIDRSLWWQDGPDGEPHLQIVLDNNQGAWWYEVYRVDADLAQRLVADGGPFPTVDEAERVSRAKARSYSSEDHPVRVAAALMVRTPAPGA